MLSIGRFARRAARIIIPFTALLLLQLLFTNYYGHSSDHVGSSQFGITEEVGLITSPITKTIPESTEPKNSNKDAKEGAGKNLPTSTTKGENASEATVNIYRYHAAGSVGKADADKQEAIRKMIRHAWSGYKKYAWGADELNPETKDSYNWTQGSSMLFTPIDSMGTLYISGLISEFKDAKELVLQHLDFAAVKSDVNVFETVIRVLGGLISTYDLDGDDRILKKAIDLGNRLSHVFNTPNGIPNNIASLSTERSEPGQISLATAGSIQLEHQYLTDVSGDANYANKALFALEQICSIKTRISGLGPKLLSTSELVETSSEYGIGANTDSYYEYLLKLWISTGDDRYRDLYDNAIAAIEEHLLVQTPDGHAYVPDKTTISESRFHHLSCFSGGMIATGAATKPSQHSDRLMKIAAQITRTCYDSYQIRPRQLGGEWTGVDQEGQLYIQSQVYRLRPETVESIFYMWRYTHDPIYREWGWNIVQALEKHCRDEVGYHGLEESNGIYNRQESFFLAETLKYLFLLFSDDDTIGLDKYVFNTEAHPISIRGHGRRHDSGAWVPIPAQGTFKS
ncbi:hypothetical protein BASA60_001859 [Batrachochytrium salamandrivorans]|nr:hypothetical protein BASA62_004519 [Batrachochytrium salamandrivorans]KAH6582614.1 hypothetical protein BASA60_001859 [Batrachochytrium salamandrivorans]